MSDKYECKIEKISNGFIFSDSETISTDYKSFYKDIDAILDIIKNRIEKLI